MATATLRLDSSLWVLNNPLLSTKGEGDRTDRVEKIAARNIPVPNISEASVPREEVVEDINDLVSKHKLDDYHLSDQSEVAKENMSPVSDAHALSGKYAQPFTWEVFEGGFKKAWDGLWNDSYVTEQWGAAYYADTLAAAFDGLKTSFKDRKVGQFFTVLGKAFWHVEVANFFKGIIGIIGTIPRLIKHTVLFPLYLLAFIVLVPFAYIGTIFCNEKIADEFAITILKGFLSNFGGMIKDIATIVASAGHSVAFWVPMVIAMLPVPGSSGAAAGVFIAMLKGFGSLSSMPGVFDLMANVGSFIVLNLDSFFLNNELNRLIESDEASNRMEQINSQLDNIYEQIDHLKEELNPNQFGGYCTWLMMFSSAIGFALHFIPGGSFVADTIPSMLPSEVPTSFMIDYGLANIPAYALRKKTQQTN